VHVIVAFFDFIFDGSNFECNAGPFPLVELDEFFNRRIIIVSAERDLCEVIVTEVIQPNDCVSLAFCAADHCHEVRMAILHQPASRRFDVMQRMASQSKFGKSILHEPLMDLPIS